MKYLVTGSAGFIGFRLCQRLLESGHEVIGIDNMNTYYDQGLKQSRLNILKQYKHFHFDPIDITDREKYWSCVLNRISTALSTLLHRQGCVTHYKTHLRMLTVT